jgi:transcriptional pleiotropic regulator of transition state genes
MDTTRVVGSDRAAAEDLFPKLPSLGMLWKNQAPTEGWSVVLENGGGMDTGIARKIDDLGRIVIPAETRRLFNIHEGDQLGISVEGDAIVIRKLEATCTFCGSTDEVGSFKGKGVCASCRAQLA